MFVRAIKCITSLRVLRRNALTNELERISYDISKIIANDIFQFHDLLFMFSFIYIVLARRAFYFLSRLRSSRLDHGKARKIA